MAITDNMSIEQKADETIIRIKHPKGTKFPPSGGIDKVDDKGAPKGFTLTVGTTRGFELLNNGMKLSLNLQQPISRAEQEKIRAELAAPESEPDTLVV